MSVLNEVIPNSFCGVLNIFLLYMPIGNKSYLFKYIDKNGFILKVYF